VGKIRTYIRKHVFQTVFVVTVILFIIDLTNIPSSIPILSNISESYDWLGYFGAIIGVYATVKIFELTLANDRNNRQRDFEANQQTIINERRLSNLPWLSIRILKPSDTTLQKVRASHFLYLEIENVGLNHAIVTHKKEDYAPTEELSEGYGDVVENVESFKIIKKDCKKRIIFPITDSSTTEFRIYYMDIYKNYYYNIYEINPKRFVQSQYNSAYYHHGTLTIKKISEYDSDRLSMV